MAQEQIKTPGKTPRDAAIDAALTLAAARDWGTVGIGDIAREAGLSLAGLHDIFEDKSDILAAYNRRVDRRVLETFGGGAGDSARDRLFDILMERFDILNEDRAAIVSILNSFHTDPKEAVIAFPHLGRTMAWMLEAAGTDTAGTKGAARVAGLGVVYLATLRIWKDDDSADMGKTMAALDRYLDRGDSIIKTFGL